jgi:hypothetical protein
MHLKADVLPAGAFWRHPQHTAGLIGLLWTYDQCRQGILRRSAARPREPVDLPPGRDTYSKPADRFANDCIGASLRIYGRDHSMAALRGISLPACRHHTRTPRGSALRLRRRSGWGGRVGQPPGRLRLYLQSWQARHHDYPGNTEMSCEVECLQCDLMRTSTLRPRVQRISRTVRCRNCQSMVSKCGKKISARTFILEQVIELNMRRRRPVSTPKLKAFNLQAGDSGKHCSKAEVRQTVSQHPDFHAMVKAKI